MPLTETYEQEAVRLAAELLTQLRREMAEREQRRTMIDIDTLRMLETQMWTAYAYVAAQDA